MTWTLDDIPDLRGKAVVVTGSTSGIGIPTLQELVRKGATGVMAVRNVTKGERVRDEMGDKELQARIKIMEIDTSSMASVKKFAENFKAEYKRLDLLINNAGVAFTSERVRTEDGLERVMATNHFGHFALTGLLLDVMKATPGSRVVVVSSLSHRQTKGINYDSAFMKDSAPPHRAMESYGESKLANVLFVDQLTKRLKSANIDTPLPLLAHPGLSDTPMARNPPSGSVTSWIFKQIVAIFAQSAERGAMPTLMAATDPLAKAGDMYGPGGVELRGPPKRGAKIAPAGKDDAAGKVLWEMSEKATGVKYLS